MVAHDAMHNSAPHDGLPVDVDVVVAGAGVIGIAIARTLAQAGREVLVLESEGGIGEHTSSRNSEVVHAGLYYPTGSLKARMCVAGRDLLYDYCAQRGVPHRRIGKVLIATADSERPALETIRRQAAANGVAVEPLDAAQVAELEPAVVAVAGLWSPLTGIVDSHAFMLALQGDAEAAGATFAFRTHVAAVAVDLGESGPVTVTTAGEDATTLRCRLFVNACGLGANALAIASGGGVADGVAPLWLAKGHYFSLGGRSPFRHLVYPMPSPAGLGVHVTLDLAGQARFGPDVGSWSREVDYRFDDDREVAFYAAIRRYYPALADGALQRGYTGLRPKLVAPGSTQSADFRIVRDAGSGHARVIQLFGIESPGLTASLAIAKEVERLTTRSSNTV